MEEQTPEPEVFGRPLSYVKSILDHFEWNWYLAADHLDCHPTELKMEMSRYQPNTAAVLDTEDLYTPAKLKPEDVAKLREFTQVYLKDALPVLLDEDITEERKAEIASSILLDFGLPYQLSHAEDCKSTYARLEDEALALEKWREQDMYLRVVEEALFKISVKLDREVEETRAATKSAEDALLDSLQSRSDDDE